MSERDDPRAAAIGRLVATLDREQDRKKLYDPLLVQGLSGAIGILPYLLNDPRLDEVACHLIYESQEPVDALPLDLTDDERDLVISFGGEASQARKRELQKFFEGVVSNLQ